MAIYKNLYNIYFRLKIKQASALRTPLSYIYNIDLGDNTVYKDSVMGLPKNLCIQQAQEEDITVANEIILKNGNK